MHHPPLRFAVVAWILAVGLLGAGCYSLFGDAEGFCTEYAAVTCENAFRCCTGREIESFMGEEYARDEGRCRKDLEVLCRDAFANQIYAVDKGTVEFDRDRAVACLDAMRVKDECVVMAEEHPAQEACEESPFQGTQADGAACVWDFECVEDAFCDGVNCRALPGQGDPCPNGVCAEDFYCGSDGGGMVCLARKGDGEACSSASECQEELYCDTTCQTPQPGGATCSTDIECASSQCSDGTCPDGRYCTDDYDCDDACELSGDSCWSDIDCPGACSTAATSCTYASDCPAGEQCLHEACVPGSCQGRVCASEQLMVIDYCWF